MPLENHESGEDDEDPCGQHGFYTLVIVVGLFAGACLLWLAIPDTSHGGNVQPKPGELTVVLPQ